MKKLMITSNDVLNSNLITHWSQLKEMEEIYFFIKKKALSGAR